MMGTLYLQEGQDWIYAQVLNRVPSLEIYISVERGHSDTWTHAQGNMETGGQKGNDVGDKEQEARGHGAICLSLR